MTSTQLGAALAGVVLVCWIVGAYNRLVSLRNVLVERFAAIDALCRSRHALIERQVTAGLSRPPQQRTRHRNAHARQLLVHHRFIAVNLYAVGVVQHQATSILDRAAKLVIVAKRAAHIIHQAVDLQLVAVERPAQRLGLIVALAVEEDHTARAGLAIQHAQETGWRPIGAAGQYKIKMMQSFYLAAAG